MSFAPPAPLPRCGVVDLGSNSVRLVVFEGHTRNPVPIFNEKAVLRLGRGMQTTGMLNEDGVTQALTVMHRYHAVARAMGAQPFEVLATAAVRDADNGPDFVNALQERMPGVPIRILSGLEEAAYAAEGMLCGIPAANGVLADIGGGSLEVVRLVEGARGPSQTLKLGVIRLAERSGGDPLRARAIAEADLQTVPWLSQAADGDLYLVGGAWRALARIHIAQTGYPLQMVHHYTIGREEARDLAGPDIHRSAQGAGTASGSATPPHRRSAIRRCRAAPAVTVDKRASRGVQRQRVARGLVHAPDASGDPGAGPDVERRVGNGRKAWPRSVPAARADRMDPAAICSGVSGRGSVARGDVLDVGSRQP